MPVLAGLKRFAATRKGKVVIGGTAVGGAVVAGLVARSRAGGDPAAGEEITAPPFSIAPGSPSGAGFGFDEITNPTVDMGQFEEMLANLARAADALDDLAAKPGGAVKAPVSSPFKLHRYGRVGEEYGLRDVAKRFASDPNNPNSVEAMLRRLVAANPTLKGRTTLPGGFALKVPA